LIPADNQTGDRTNMTKLSGDFYDFANAPKNHIKNRIRQNASSCSVDAFLMAELRLNTCCRKKVKLLSLMLCVLIYKVSVVLERVKHIK